MREGGGGGGGGGGGDVLCLPDQGIVMDSGAGARCRQEIEDGSRFPRPGVVRSAVRR